MWHKRLGHPSAIIVQKALISCNLLTAINEKKSFCESCQKGKSHKLPFGMSTSEIHEPLEVIHTDL